MSESWTRCPKIAGSSLRPAGIVGGGSECTELSSAFNTTTEVHLNKALNPQMLHTAPGVCSRCVCVCVCVCVFTAVCVHFGWVKCRAQILSMGQLTWPLCTMLISCTQFYCSCCIFN